MKTRALFTLGLAFAVVLFGSFMVREREESVNPSPDYYLLQGDKSFTAFIGNLQKMESIVYIPKSKVTEMRGLGLTLLPRDKAVAVNKQLAGSVDDYVQLFPGDKAGEAVSLSFDKLDMISYVRQEKATTKALDMFYIKMDPGKIYHKVESVTIDAARPEELQLKVEGSKVMQAYVPVGIIDIDTLP